MSRSRSWVFTWNNYDESVVERLREPCTSVKYLVAGKEVGDKGTPHLQGFVQFKNQLKMKAVSKFLPKAYLSISKDVFAAIEYCKKDGDFFEVGVPPKKPKEKGKMEIDRWDAARKCAELGDFANIPSDIFYRYNSQSYAIRNRYLEERVLSSNDFLDNHWYYGATGTGKSSFARKAFPDAFIKSLNKWWNGYTDQENVIVDDIDPSHESWVGHFIKIWTDHYPFNAEIKGGTRMIRPKRFVFTSQYSIAQIFKDPETVLALQRRFKVTHFPQSIFNPQ